MAICHEKWNDGEFGDDEIVFDKCILEAAHTWESCTAYCMCLQPWCENCNLVPIIPILPDKPSNPYLFTVWETLLYC